MDFFKNVYFKKMGLFPVLWRKNFFLWRRARSRGVGVRGLLRGVPDGFGVRVDGCEAFRARVDGCDGGCACLI